MSLHNEVQEYISITQSIQVESLEKLAHLIYNVSKNGNQIFVCGNGGSGATANLMAFGLTNVSGYTFKALSLNNNMGMVTESSNNYGYAYSFNNQIKAFAQNGDLLILISCSGNSLNVLNAVHQAKSQNVKTFSLTGMGGGRLSQISDDTVIVDSYDMQQIENIHSLIINSVVRNLSVYTNNEVNSYSNVPLNTCLV